MTTNQTQEEQQYKYQPGTKVAFEGITEPGCYICNWNGHLLRVPSDGVAAGRSPLLTIIAHEELFVTKLHNDPYVPLTKARMTAANWDIAVSF